MNPAATLEILLEAGNWDAVEEAAREGKAALPILQHFARSTSYETRQIALACAASIGGEAAAEILAAGLTDPNINVRLQAAKELSSGKFPAAGPAVLEQLAHSDEFLIREPLALAAGYLPADRAVPVLRTLSEGFGSLSVNARMALAKLGDPEARAALVRELSSSRPRTRYDALGELVYVNDVTLAPYAEKLLGDRESALRIGTVRRPQYRRVCDQAVDTIVFLLRLGPSFPVKPERIYTEPELEEIRDLVRRAR
ncbi:MAG: HEAT repeat domain-containing protein [Terriglobia bacterium]